MNVIVKHINSGIPENQHDFFNKFISFLQKEVPLKKDITILFLGEKTEGMSTGSRNNESVLKILSKNRMNRDICRTLAHEWVHEYQVNVLNRDRGPDIGGENEDEANSKAGSLIKSFEKENPNKEPKMYEQKNQPL
jgi:hypothetical protein